MMQDKKTPESTYHDLLVWAEDRLKCSGDVDAKTDAWLLMEYCFSITRLSYLLEPKAAADSKQRKRYLECLEERAGGKPLQYITGEQEFMGLRFLVTPDVLIPRQDTEILVTAILESMRGAQRVLDMCTGSGCILLSLLAHRPQASGIGSDLSEAALRVAKENERRIFGTAGCDRAGWCKGDLFENIQGTFDVIAANPPYIPTEEIRGLMREVRCHEPIMALDGSTDGLRFYRILAREAPAYLREGGSLFLEIGWNQAEAVTGLLQEAGWRQILVRKDLAGLDRVISAKRGAVGL